MEMLNIIKGAIFGHAVADALGVPVEFKSREYLRKNPVIDMIGFGTYCQPKGTWSDDTSMTLCTLESITKKGKIDLENIMEIFAKWRCFGYMTPFDDCFDIGNATYSAISRYLEGKSFPYGINSEYSNGNGSLMRILPVSLYHHFKWKGVDKRLKDIHNVSMLTHAHERSVIACGIYDFVLEELINNPTKEAIKKGLNRAYDCYDCLGEINTYSRLFKRDFESLSEDEIKSSGYVVDTLEAVIWCLLNTNSYKECVLKAVNLGEDTDTVGAIAGGLAGVIYGYNSIPTEWLDCLAKKEMIDKLCFDFANIL